MVRYPVVSYTIILLLLACTTGCQKIHGPSFAAPALPKANVDPIAGVQSGNVSITYQLVDKKESVGSIEVFYSTDGTNFTEATAMAGTNTTNLGANVFPGVEHTYTWNSVEDGIALSGQVDDVTIRIQPSDSGGSPGTRGSVQFNVNNVAFNEPPEVVITQPTGVKSGNFDIDYTLSDHENNTCSVVLEYSDNGGSTWYPATITVPNDTTTGLGATPGGTAHSVTWASRFDNVAMTAQNDAVMFRITPSDSFSSGNAATIAVFSVDNFVPNQAPLISIDSGPSGVTSDNSPTFTYSGTDADGIVMAYFVGINEDPPTTNVGTDTSWTSPELENGIHTFYVFARDNEGCDSIIVSRSFDIVPNQPPELTILSGPANDSTIATKKVTFTWSAIDPDGIVDGYFYSFDNTTLDQWTTGTSIESDFLDNGVHIFRLMALDNGGAMSQMEMISFTVAAPNLPPDVTIMTGPSGSTGDNTPTFTWQGIDTDGTVDGYYISLDVDPPDNWTTLTNWTSPTELPEGTYTFHVMAVDNDGANSSVTSRIFILNATPDAPTYIGSLDTAGAPYCIYVSGYFAYVADITSLRIIDISNPTLPVEESMVPTDYGVWGVYVAGSYAYIANDDFGLKIIDISDISSPVIIGTYNTPGKSLAVFVSGTYAFVADGVGGLQVIDVSDPSSPSFAGSYNTPGWAKDVCVVGHHAYVADGIGGGLQIIDVSDPTNPTLTGWYNTPGDANGVAVSGSFAYVADIASDLQIIDIFDPANPVFSASYSTPDASLGLCVQGPYVYMADNASGLQIVDVSDPANPISAGSYDTPGESKEVFVLGSIAYIADSIDGGLQIIETNLPDRVNPTFAGSYDTPDDAIGVYVSGSYAYVAIRQSGLQVIDISDLQNPTLTGSYDTSGTSRDVYISGSYAYVADGDSGLQVLDISDPANPMPVGSCDTPDFAYSFYVSGSYAYVADRASGLQIIDISDPANPTLAGSYDTSQALGVYVSGSYAYVADDYIGLLMIDISDPATPTLAGSYDTPGRAYGVYVSGTYAYVADWNSGLQIIDISGPATPTLAGSYDTPYYARGVYVRGSYAYVADEDSGLLVIDISDPANPTLAGSYDTPGIAWRVYLSGSNAYVADEGSGLQIIKIFE